MEETAKLIEAIAQLIGALAWPVVAVVALVFFGPSLRLFFSALSELRLRGRGFEAFAVRRLDLDATSKKLYDFWKPGGKIDRSNAARIAGCMRQLGIAGSVAWLINAGTAEDRARVAERLSIDS